MNLDLRGKRAVVGGSTQGIGKASAIELAQLGATVTLLRNEEKPLKAAALRNCLRQQIKAMITWWLTLTIRINSNQLFSYSQRLMQFISWLITRAVRLQVQLLMRPRKILLEPLPVI